MAHVTTTKKRPNFKLEFDFGLEVEFKSFNPNGWPTFSVKTSSAKGAMELESQK